MWNSMILVRFGIKIITTKPLSSVARWCLGNGTPSPPSRWAQWRSWRIFQKTEQLSRDGADGFFKKSSSSGAELTDFSKNRAAPANVESFPFSFNLVYFSGVYFLKTWLSRRFFFSKKKLNNPALRTTTEGPPSLKPFYIKNPTHRLTITYRRLSSFDIFSFR